MAFEANAGVVAALVGLAALPLNEIPDKAAVERMRSPEFVEALRAVSVDGSFDDGIRDGAATMAAYLAGPDALSADEMVEDMGVDRTRLYRGISPDYGPPYPAEAVWRGLDGVDAARFVETLVSEMRYAGASPTSGSERPDYLGMELQFVRFLLDRAGQFDDSAEHGAMLARCSAFCSGHLEWVEEYVQAAQPYAATPFFEGHLSMLKGLCRQLPSMVAAG